MHMGTRRDDYDGEDEVPVRARRAGPTEEHQVSEMRQSEGNIGNREATGNVASRSRG